MPEDEQPVGIWGQRHLLLTGKLNSYLAEVDDHAAQMLDSLTKQISV